MKRKTIILLTLGLFSSGPFLNSALGAKPFDSIQKKSLRHWPFSCEAHCPQGLGEVIFDPKEPKLWAEIPYVRITFSELCDRLLQLGIVYTGYPSSSFVPKVWGYRAVPIEELKNFMEWYTGERKRTQYKLIAGSDFWLCTDAALDFLAAARRWYPEIALAVAHGFPAYTNYSSHAFCIFVDIKRKIWLIDWVKGIVLAIEEDPGLILRGVSFVFM